jgi:DNA-binding beta-propeller fold protein YncE
MGQVKTHGSPLWLLLLMMSASLLCCGTASAMGMSFGGQTPPTSEPATGAALKITSGPFSSPVGIAPVFARSGLSYLLVTDAGKRTVSKADPQHPDNVEELFKVDGLPLGIAQDRRFIYVGNRSEGSVDIYHGSRKGLRMARRIKTDEPMQPNDIAIDAGARQFFVVDGAANDVKVFTLSGRLVRTIDGFGDLFDPKSVAIHAKSRSIAVTDAGDPKTGMPASVQVYDYSGRQLLRKTGGFSAPRGVAVSADRLFVADALLGQVLVFDRKTGEYLGAFGSFGTDPGQLLFPIDVAFDEKTEALYVVNNRMGRLETFAPTDFQPAEVTQ